MFKGMSGIDPWMILTANQGAAFGTFSFMISAKFQIFSPFGQVHPKFEMFDFFQTVSNPGYIQIHIIDIYPIFK